MKKILHVHLPCHRHPTERKVKKKDTSLQIQATRNMEMVGDKFEMVFFKNKGNLVFVLFIKM